MLILYFEHIYSIKCSSCFKDISKSSSYTPIDHLGLLLFEVLTSFLPFDFAPSFRVHRFSTTQIYQLLEIHTPPTLSNYKYHAKCKILNLFSMPKTGHFGTDNFLTYDFAWVFNKKTCKRRNFNLKSCPTRFYNFYFAPLRSDGVWLRKGAL